MVEGFKTNAEELKASKQIIQVLLEQFNSHKVNFDLDDCDKILRVHGKPIILYERTRTNQRVYY